jgi:hypothetical protein
MTNTPRLSQILPVNPIRFITVSPDCVTPASAASVTPRTYNRLLRAYFSATFFTPSAAALALT